jgi:hypothetical protein
VPSVPTAPTVSAGDAAVTVSWSPPDDGGSPITSYVVTPSTAGGADAPRAFDSAATTEVVTGLSNGTGYTFTVTAANAVGSSSPSAPSPEATPLASSLTIVNVGGKAGRAQEGDQIILVFAPAPSPAALCTAWSATSYPDLVDPGVVVQGTEPSSGDDTLTVTDTTDCHGGFHFGTIDLGQRGYFNSGATFGGSGQGCKNAKTSQCSTIHWDGHNTLTITLGHDASTQPIQTTASIAVYTPDPTLGLPGPISSDPEQNF